MKFKFLSLSANAILLLCLVYLTYHFYGWRQSRQRQKALFVYFQQSSPLTKRIPEDALAYINLYDLRRIHTEIRKTKLNEVWTHWVDTGMSDHQKSNPLRGGMLEKMILNVLGQEFAISLLPSKHRSVDFLAIARIASGSELVLKLALLSSKDAQKVDYRGGTVYVFNTKDPLYPRIHVFLQDDLVFAASTMDRLQEAAAAECSGPAFLRNLDVQPIPEDTFLFVQTREPLTSLLGFGRGNVYHFQASSETYGSHLPKLKINDSTVLHFQTNITEIFRQPSLSYLLNSKEGMPVSSLLLSFRSARDAKKFRAAQLSDFSEQQSPVPLQTKKMECFQVGGKFFCHQDASILLAEQKSVINQSAIAMKTVQESQLPLTFQVTFQRQATLPYLDRVQKKDWSSFSTAKEFYFLSCIRQMKNTGNELTIELE